MAKITGSFEYDMDDRSLIFEFDDASKRYVSQTQPFSLTVEPQVDKACGIWHDEDGKPIPSIPAIRLTFSPKSKYNGLLVDVVQATSIKEYQAARVVRNSEGNSRISANVLIKK